MHSYMPLDLLEMPLEGTSLIEASAGTGKTFTIANLFLRLILEKELDVKKILVVTFTEAATKELRDIIRKNLNDALGAAGDSETSDNEAVMRSINRALESKSVETAKKLLRNAVICFDEASIFTIHGFCKRVLDENAFESAIMFDTELVTDQGPLLQEITDDFWRKHFSGSTVFLNAVADRHRLTYAALAALSRSVVSRPLLTLIPEAAPGALENLTRAHESMQSEWHACADSIKEVLRSEKTGFKRNRKPFRANALEGFLEKIAVACSDNPTPEALAIIELFTTRYLTGCLKKGYNLPLLKFFDLCEAYTRGEPNYAIWVKQQYVAYLRSELSKRKRETNVQSFDDLLTTVHASLQADSNSPLAKAIRRKFDAALIDEFQDTDPIQYDIFRTVFSTADKSLFLIGDPKQSIYGFRGADIFAYIQAAANIPGLRKFTLEENWRSESDLVAAANTFFNHAKNPFVLGDAVGYNEVRAADKSVGNQAPLKVEGDNSGSLALWFINRENTGTSSKNPTKDEARETAASAVVSEISRILALSLQGLATLGSRPVKPSDFAVLVTRNVDARLFSERLGMLGIPTVITRGGMIFKTEESREVEHILTAISTPGNPVNLNTALATGLIGCPADEILVYVEDETRFAAFEFHLTRFSKYHELWKTRGFMVMFRKFMLDYGVRQKLLALPYGERRITNVLHIAELIHTAAFENDLGINGILNWISDQRASDEEKTEQELRLERDDEAVQILTVFRSKGLQYPIVFCPFMWQQDAAPRGDNIVFHAKNRHYLDIGTDPREKESKTRAARENLSELVRLLYVAITRAQNRCYLSFGKIGTPAATSLGYILTGGSEPEDDIFTRVKETIKSLDEDALYESARQHIADSENLISLTAPAPLSPAPYRPPADNRVHELANKVFGRERTITSDWKVASFSMLVSEKASGRSEYQQRSMKADEFTTGEIESKPPPANTFFTFPGGTVTGSCIHAIFENLDFSMRDTAKNQALIERMLKKFGLDEPTPPVDFAAPRADIVHKMATAVMQAPLMPGSPDFTLNRIPPDHQIPELEFYYPVNRFTPNSLNAVFSRFDETKELHTTVFRERIETLEFKPVQGFMRGFIDLVFHFEGKYYLLDWKTNNLGNRHADYAIEYLAESMARAMYNLQYYIYTVALHKHLESRISDYDYDRHYGGVFYLFIRGMHPDHPGNGVFFDRPSKGLVEALSNLFGR